MKKYKKIKKEIIIEYSKLKNYRNTRHKIYRIIKLHNIKNKKKTFISLCWFMFYVPKFDT